MEAPHMLGNRHRFIRQMSQISCPAYCKRMIAYASFQGDQVMALACDTYRHRRRFYSARVFEDAPPLSASLLLRLD